MSSDTSSIRRPGGGSATLIARGATLDGFNEWIPEGANLRYFLTVQPATLAAIDRRGPAPCPACRRRRP